MHQSVKQKFTTYPENIAVVLHEIRSLILQVAVQDGITELEETLKWGEPSYISKIGTTIRFDHKPKSAEQFCIYFNCKTKLIETFLQFNDNTVERGLFYQAMHATLEVALNDDLEIEDYIHSFTRMFGQKVMDAVVGSINGDVMFYGLTPTNMQLEGLDRHQRLIDSYKKLHGARAARAK